MYRFFFSAESREERTREYKNTISRKNAPYFTPRFRRSAAYPSIKYCISKFTGTTKHSKHDNVGSSRMWKSKLNIFGNELTVSLLTTRDSVVAALRQF